MPTICDLYGVRTPTLTGWAIAAATIARDDLNRRSGLQPRLNRSRLAIRQDIDDPPPSEVTDDCSLAAALPPGPVIDPDHSGCAIRWRCSSAHYPEQRITADRENQTPRRALPRSATKGEADVMYDSFETLRPPPEALCNRRVKPLCENLHRATNRPASKPSRSKLQVYR